MLCFHFIKSLQKKKILPTRLLSTTNTLITSKINSGARKPLSAGGVYQRLFEYISAAAPPKQQRAGTFTPFERRPTEEWRRSRSPKHPFTLQSLCRPPSTRRTGNSARNARSLLHASQKKQQNVIRSERFWQSCQPDTLLLHAGSPRQQEVCDSADPQPQQ